MDLQAVTGMLTALFPGDVALAVAPPSDHTAALYPIEAEAIGKAVAKRRNEFATARVCARRALAALGRDASPIPSGEDRAPRWPEGVVGTIAHTDALCVAAVAEASRYASLGLDVEPRRSLGEETFALILTERERSIAEQSEDAGLYALAVFCAKECFYKCQYPLTRTFLDFADVEVALATSGVGFSVTLLREASKLPVGASFDGRLSMRNDVVAAAMVWAASARNGENVRP